MLKERIIYQDEIPVDLLVVEIESYPIHFHEDCEVLYVLDGEVCLRDGYYDYDLKKGDVFIVNDGEMHSIKKVEGKSNKVMLMHLDFSYFSQYYPNLKNSFFYVDRDEDDAILQVLKSILIRILAETLQKGMGYERKVIESAHNLISYMQADFQSYLMDDDVEEGNRQSRRNKVMAERLSRITKYMYDNYDRKLTLNEIGEQEHLSIYYLSHVIKDATGLSFQDLLSFIRVEESEKLLLDTDKKIGAIAAETGFSAVRYYIKHFEYWFHMHPKEYRKKFKGETINRDITAQMRRCTVQEIRECIKEHDGMSDEMPHRKYTAPVIIDMDLKDVGKTRSAKTPKVIPMEYMMGKDVMRAIAGPYRTIRSLKESVVATGSNYLVTMPANEKDDVKSVSILVYNFDDENAEKLKEAQSVKDVANVINTYDKDMEFLLRCAGLTGNFDVFRYRLSQENCQMTYRRLMQEGAANSRDLVRQKWISLPCVEFEEFTLVGTLNLRTKLNGFSAELILIDKKD